MGKLDALYYSATRYENCDYRDHFSVLQVPARDIKNLAIPYLLVDSGVGNKKRAARLSRLALFS
jgi:hypothetical protein